MLARYLVQLGRRSLNSLRLNNLAQARIIASGITPYRYSGIGIRKTSNRALSGCSTSTKSGIIRTVNPGSNYKPSRSNLSPFIGIGIGTGIILRNLKNYSTKSKEITGNSLTSHHELNNFRGTNMKFEDLHRMIIEDNVSDDSIIYILSTPEGKKFLTLSELSPFDNILQIAIASGRTKVAHYMIDNIALERLDTQNTVGDTALFTAFKSGSWSTALKLIAKGVNVNHINNYQQNIVSFVLFEMGTYANNGCYYRNHGPLEYAAMFELLLKVKEPSAEDVTAIEKWIDISKHGGFYGDSREDEDYISKSDDFNFVCIIEKIYATHKQNPDNHVILDIKKCEDPAYDIVNESLQYTHKLPTTSFANIDKLIGDQSFSDDVIIGILQQEQNLTLLLREYRDVPKQNILHLSVLAKRDDLVDFIINNSHEIFLESQTWKEVTPLFEAFRVGSVMLAQKLLAKGASLDHTFENGDDLCDFMITKIWAYSSSNLSFYDVDINGFIDTFALMLEVKNVSDSQLNDIAKWITEARDILTQEGIEVKRKANEPDPITFEFIDKIESLVAPYLRSANSSMSL